MALLLIGEFAARAQLSAKALRLYDELGLLVPVEVDKTTGYRYYSADQLSRARLVALLRHLDMPLPRIAAVLDLPGIDAATAVREFWAERERDLLHRRPTVDYLCTLLSRKDTPVTRTYEVLVRAMPDRAVVSAIRHVHAAQAGDTLGALLARMRQAGPGLPGLAGCPYTIYHGAVSDDSDGPVEIVRPMTDLPTAEQAAATLGDIQAHLDPAHDEIAIRLTMAEAAWPAVFPALDAIQAHLTTIGRTPAGPPRQVLIADWRTTPADQPACDLVIPLAAPPS
ncbi:MerR family transcriptional regulator [Actinophytocola sp.]|uniref:MerR family transcriptional regulator n=1 Tax=Actinophytocola sp. TaxID=1872138 RepID=UPI002D7E79C1|nr:MerR family transcriptional regulator [Actinophytocola sp.]HET9142579.1 MerR family transcriptional regulator [Actinophytocola sp.]